MQKHLLALATGVGALALSTAAFAQSNNRAFVDQGYGAAASSNSTVTVTQDGSNNAVGNGTSPSGPTSSPSGLGAYFRQHGSGNVADVLQQGNSNLFGYDNGSPTPAFANPANSFGQSGTNTLDLRQVGDSNKVGTFTQQGVGNTASVKQTGTGNYVASLTQKGVGSTMVAPTGGNNVAEIQQIGNSNGLLAATPTFRYFGSGASGTQTVTEVGGSNTVAAPAFTSAGINNPANLDQTGSGNTARVGFTGNGNNFNIKQDSNSDTLSAGAGNRLFAGANASSQPTTIAAFGAGSNNNYIYADQTGIANLITLEAPSLNGYRMAAIQNGSGDIIQWTVGGGSSGASLEAVQNGNGNTIRGSQWGSTNHRVLAYQLGDNNRIYATAANAATGSTIDMYQDSTGGVVGNTVLAVQWGANSNITTQQIGNGNIAAAIQYGSGAGNNKISISQR